MGQPSRRPLNWPEIDAHFEMTEQANATDNPGKFQDIVKRRLERGQFYSIPYFGTLRALMVSFTSLRRMLVKRMGLRT